MSAPERVAVFTASGTFRGTKGTIRQRNAHGAYVALDGEPFPLFFSNSEIVRLTEPHVAGAE